MAVSRLRHGDEKLPFSRGGAAVIENHNGRPLLPSLVASTAADMARDESFFLYVCGPRDMQQAVRDAVTSQQISILRGGRGRSEFGSDEGAKMRREAREESGSRDVSLHVEHFQWA